MFENLVNEIKFGNEIKMSLHTILETFRHLEIGQQGLLIFIIILFISLLFTDIFWVVTVCFKIKSKETNELEGLADWPRCFRSIELDNYIEEEYMVREKFKYKKMFDTTLENFVKVRAESDQGNYRLSIVNRGITDAISYDPCLQPDYYHEFYYVPFGERHFTRNFDELDEI